MNFLFAFVVVLNVAVISSENCFRPSLVLTPETAYSCYNGSHVVVTVLQSAGQTIEAVTQAVAPSDNFVGPGTKRCYTCTTALFSFSPTIMAVAYQGSDYQLAIAVKYSELPWVSVVLDAEATGAVDVVTVNDGRPLLVYSLKQTSILMVAKWVAVWPPKLSALTSAGSWVKRNLRTFTNLDYIYMALSASGYPVVVAIHQLNQLAIIPCGDVNCDSNSFFSHTIADAASVRYVSAAPAGGQFLYICFQRWTAENVGYLDVRRYDLSTNNLYSLSVTDVKGGFGSTMLNLEGLPAVVHFRGDVSEAALTVTRVNGTAVLNHRVTPRGATVFPSLGASAAIGPGLVPAVVFGREKPDNSREVVFTWSTDASLTEWSSVSSISTVSTAAPTTAPLTDTSSIATSVTTGTPSTLADTEFQQQQTSSSFMPAQQQPVATAAVAPGNSPSPSPADDPEFTVVLAVALTAVVLVLTVIVVLAVFARGRRLRSRAAPLSTPPPSGSAGAGPGAGHGGRRSRSSRSRQPSVSRSGRTHSRSGGNYAAVDMSQVKHPVEYNQLVLERSRSPTNTYYNTSLAPLPHEYDDISSPLQAMNPTHEYDDISSPLQAMNPRYDQINEKLHSDEDDDATASTTLKPSTRLFVSNLPLQLTKEKLADHFGSQGDVTECRICTRKDGTSRRIAFVGYATKEQAKRAQSYFHKTYIGMVQIDVQFALPKTEMSDRKRERVQQDKREQKERKKRNKQRAKQREAEAAAATSETPEQEEERPKKKAKKKEKKSRESADAATAAVPLSTAATTSSSPGGAQKGTDDIDYSRLFCRNFAYSTTEQQLQQLFSPFGELMEVHIAVDSLTHQSKGYGFVQFSNAVDAEQARNALDKSTFRGRVLTVTHAQRKPGADAAADLLLHGAKDLVDPTAAATVIDKKTDYKRAKQLETQQYVQNRDTWSSLFVRSSTVQQSIRQGSAADSSAFTTGDFAATSVALGETAIIADTKRFESLPLMLEFAPAALLGTDDTDDGDQQEQNDSLEKNNVVNDDDDDDDEINDNDNDKDDDDDDDDADDEKPVVHTLYVKNLSFATTESQLRAVVEKLNPEVTVRNVYIARKKGADSKKLGQSLGFGFVEFKTEADMMACFSALHGFTVDGHALTVERAAQKSKQQQQSATKKSVQKRQAKIDKADANPTPPSSKLMIKNVAFQATKDDLFNLLRAFGTLKSVRIPKKFDGTHRGFAFAEFLSIEEAVRAKEALAHTHLYGRRLVIDFAEAGAQKI